ncbi:MAG TPA: DUF4142 domain-containing protein [Devosia sp.]|nr:DUF4142 domain-containing protein [Devosia sp.]
MRYLPIITAVAALFAPAAYAQMGNPAGLTPGTEIAPSGVPVPNETNDNDRLFAQLIAVGGMAEVELGQLSIGQGQSEAVQDFARRMVDDHGAANQKLKALADAAGIPLPGELDPDHKRMQAELKDQSGREYDLVYLRAQIIEHQKAAQLLQWEIDSGQYAELQRFASETLPLVFNHLKMAQRIQAELTGTE